jgi:hemoglobin-like flavoprotein
MNSRNISLIQFSFAKIEPVSDQVADLFYARVFALHPELRPLFPQDMKVQKAKLIAMLTFIVENVLMLDTLIPALQLLGERHKGYGVIAEHYQPLGAALIWALEQSLGDEFTPETRQAWIGIYTMMANTMLQAAGNE